MEHTYEVGQKIFLAGTILGGPDKDGHYEVVINELGGATTWWFKPEEFLPLASNSGHLRPCEYLYQGIWRPARFLEFFTIGMIEVNDCQFPNSWVRVENPDGEVDDIALSSFRFTDRPEAVAAGEGKG